MERDCKIARLAAVNDLEYGGLNLIDLETYVKSSRLAWLGRIFAEGSSPWKAYINCLLKDFGGAFLFSCNYDVKDCKITSTFYRDLLQRRNGRMKNGTSSNATSLIITTPRTSCIYFLPKIHKPNNPGRPIVSACSCPTELISSYLD